MKAEELNKLMEAYNSMYAPKEEVVESEQLEEGMGLSVGLSRLGGALLSNPRTSAEQGAKNLQKNFTDPVGFAVKGAAKGAFKAVGDFIGSGMSNNRPQTPLQKNVARKTQEVLNREDVDLFDIVKGHLMSEGYADTEEAALAIMANMSEEWRQSIVEGLNYPMEVSSADVKGNTKAAQNAQAGMKLKDGSPMYKPGKGVGPDFKLLKGV